jgi:hypothetical protein
VAGVVLPVVVIHVPVAVELQPRRAARGVVDVVSSERHLVVLSVAKAIRN